MEAIQGIFYTLASIFMLLGIFFMGFLIFVTWKAYQAALQAQKDIAEMKQNVTDSVSEFVSSKPAQFASVVGMGFTAFLVKKIRDLFSGKNTG